MPTIYPLLALVLWLFAMTVWLRILALPWHQLDPRPWVRRRLGKEMRRPTVSWSAQVHPTAKLGDYVYIDDRAFIDKRVRIKTGGFVSEGAWVLPDAVVGEWATVGVRAVVAAGDVVADYAVVPCPGFIHNLAWHVLTAAGRQA